MSERADERLPRMTEAEYLAWSERQEITYEFDGFRPVAMNGGTVTHDRMTRNLLVALTLRLRGRSCQPFGPNMRIPAGQGRYRYPDAFVSCTTVDGGARDVTTPVVIFEVVSDSTARTDRSKKLVEYRAIPSLVRYVMLDQAAAEATVVTRVGDDLWRIDLLRMSDVLALPEIGIELPIGEIYDEVTLVPDDDVG